jgi:hypothetical protein
MKKPLIIMAACILCASASTFALDTPAPKRYVSGECGFAIDIQSGLGQPLYGTASNRPLAFEIAKCAKASLTIDYGLAPSLDTTLLGLLLRAGYEEQALGDPQCVITLLQSRVAGLVAYRLVLHNKKDATYEVLTTIVRSLNGSERMAYDFMMNCHENEWQCASKEYDELLTSFVPTPCE